MLKIRYFIAVFLLIAPCAVFATLYEPIEDEITANIKALYSEDQETRDTAYERLIEIGAPAVPKLIETLGVGADFLIDDTHTVENRYGSTGMRTENVPISFIAARALAGIGADAVPALIEALEQGGIDTHKWSAYALGRIKPPPSDATQPLIDALEDPNTDVRQYARGALKRMDVETIPILIYDIWAGYPFESNQAEIKLRSMYDQSEEIVPILMVLLTKADENQAESIIRVLTGHWEKSLSPMLDALETDDEQLRYLLIEAITK